MSTLAKNLNELRALAGGSLVEILMMAIAAALIDTSPAPLAA